MVLEAQLPPLLLALLLPGLVLGAPGLHIDIRDRLPGAHQPVHAVARQLQGGVVVAVVPDVDLVGLSGQRGRRCGPLGWYAFLGLLLLLLGLRRLVVLQFLRLSVALEHLLLFIGSEW